IEANNLRVRAVEYCRELLRPEGFEINAYDLRTKVPVTPGSTSGATDATKWPSGSAVTGLAERRLLDNEMGVHDDLLYTGPFGGGWPPPDVPLADWMSVKWFGPNLSIDDAPAPGMELALPALIDTIEEGAGAMHVAISGGYFDGATPYYTADYVATRVA